MRRTLLWKEMRELRPLLGLLLALSGGGLAAALLGGREMTRRAGYWVNPNTAKTFSSAIDQRFNSCSGVADAE
jgi:hypothetical protein